MCWIITKLFTLTSFPFSSHYYFVYFNLSFSVLMLFVCLFLSFSFFFLSFFNLFSSNWSFFCCLLILYSFSACLLFPFCLFYLISFLPVCLNLPYSVSVLHYFFSVCLALFLVYLSYLIPFLSALSYSMSWVWC